MPKRERSITPQDISRIVKIIQRFRSTPTWTKIAKRVGDEDLPFKQRSLQNHDQIVDAYLEKRAEIKKEQEDQRARRRHRGLPDTDDGVRDLIETLRARIAELEAANRRYRVANEAVLYNAEKLNVPREELNRPLAPNR